MSFDGLLVRDVTILRAARTTDRYNDETLDWSSPASTSTKGWLAQVGSTEPAGPGRALVVTSELVLHLPADVDVTEHDRVRIDGELFEVDGRPEHAWTPRGPHHLRLKLRSTEG